MKLEIKFSLLTGFLTALQAYLRTISSFTLNFDSWVYWEGSISICNGQGYADLLGHNITAWPPMYSLFLCAWQSLFGFSLGQVVLSNVLLAFLSGMIWYQIFSIGIRNYQDQRNAVLFNLIGCLFVSTFLVTPFEHFLSESLWTPLVGLLILLALTVRASTTWHLLFFLTLVLALQTRHQTISLLPGLALIIYLRAGFVTIRNAGVTMFLSLVLWYATRLYLEQLNSGSINEIVYTLEEKLYGFYFAIAQQITFTKIQEFGVFLLLVLIFLNGLRKRFGTSDFAGSVLYSGLMFIVITAVLMAITNVPLAQPRIFHLFGLLLFCAAFSFVLDQKAGRLLRVTAFCLICLLTLSSTYRGAFFLKYRLTAPQNYSQNFLVSRHWIQQQMRDTQNGTAENAFVLAPGYTANTLRRWKGEKLINKK